jgi:hypothetical protein
LRLFCLLTPFVASLAACGTVRFVRVGAIAPERPTDCPLRFEHLTPQQAIAGGEREVGSGCAAGYGEAHPDPADAGPPPPRSSVSFPQADPDSSPIPFPDGDADWPPQPRANAPSARTLVGDFTPAMKEDVTPLACALGGDLVVITGTCAEPSGDYGATPGIQLMVLTKVRP